MALPAMITGFGEQSANYGAVVGQSLQQLGQQVGQQLAMREYQKQAQAVLPALQQTYTSAMDKIQAGEVTEGYRDIINAQLQFGTSQNPFIADYNRRLENLTTQVANNYMKTKLYEMQYGRTGTGEAAGLPATGMPAVTDQERARQILLGGGSAPTTDTGFSPNVGTEDLVAVDVTEEEMPTGGGISWLLLM